LPNASQSLEDRRVDQVKNEIVTGLNPDEG